MEQFSSPVVPNLFFLIHRLIRQLQVFLGSIPTSSPHCTVQRIVHKSNY